jgi:DNA topoisomerase-3
MTLWVIALVNGVEMDVVICEKPSQGREVAAVLGAKAGKRGYMVGSGAIVTWCIGHLLEQYMPEDYDKKYKKWNAQDLPILPEVIRYKPKASTKSQLTIIKSLLDKAKTGRVIIATDGDREGEAIGGHVLRYCRYKGNNVYRAWLSSTDEETIKEAFANLSPIENTKNHEHAALARDEYDWLLGMNVSRALGCVQGNNKKSTFKVAFGRVQSATLGIAIKRELAIEQFVPKTHYGVKIKANHQGQTFELTWDIPESVLSEEGYLESLSDAQAVVNFVRSANVIVSDSEYKVSQVAAPLPFRLSDLIKECARYGLDPDQTTEAMQTLYDPPASLVTYPRTDNNYLPESMLDWVPSIFKHLERNGYQEMVGYCDPLLKGGCWNTKKLEGSSHHGIIPTRKSSEGYEFKNNEAIVYDVICRRFLKQFAPKAEDAKSKIACNVNGLDFVATGKTEVYKGWRSLSRKPPESARSNLPKVGEGEALGVSGVELVTKKTTPPKRFTMASLLDEMGKAGKYCDSESLKKILRDGDGIGTEATRTGILVGMKAKGHFRVDKSGSISVPKEVINFMQSNVPSELIKVDVTASAEVLLNAVERGELSLKEFSDMHRKLVTKAVDMILHKKGVVA